MNALQVSDSWMLRVADIKQFDYCPRVVFYTYCMPGIRPTTYKMDAGIAAQDRTEELEKRRSLREYGIREGVRHFNVVVSSLQLGCTGQIDLVIEQGIGDTRRLTPVDFKLSRHVPGRHFKLQLACYALLLEECWQSPVEDGVIYLIPTRSAEKVKIDTRLRRDARGLMAEIRAMLELERMPPPVRQRNRCLDCEFRRFCNDVV